ncbi:MAG TPA: hypothetical protein VK529_05100 [Gemmatimonadaceae bacterium]|nr:hypothetical protein [Gemmatimonadaceae bacterium]
MRGKALSIYPVRKSLIVPVVAAILGLVACDSLLGLVDPMFPSDAEEFSPPPVYSTWWNMTQACSGLTGSLGEVTWFKTNHVLHNSSSGESLGGYWNSFTNRIVLTTAAMLDGGSVRHEMLHSLLRKGGHPRNQFLGKCAGTVHCQGSCIRDAGPYPQPSESPIHVPGDSIEISVDIEPGNPNSAQDGGFFSMTVIVRNRSAHWATVPSYYASNYSSIFPEYDSTRTFGVDVRGPAGGISHWELRFDPSEWIFAPGETKKQIFDFTIGNDLIAHKLPPGNYIARGGYSEYWSTHSTFVIGP